MSDANGAQGQRLMVHKVTRWWCTRSDIDDVQRQRLMVHKVRG